MTKSFFFFSSRRRHTRLQGDWSSDMCSSDLPANRPREREYERISAVMAASVAATARRPTGPAETDASAPSVVLFSSSFCTDRKSVVEGKRGDLGGRRIIKKKKNKRQMSAVTL